MSRRVGHRRASGGLWRVYRPMIPSDIEKTVSTAQQARRIFTEKPDWRGTPPFISGKGVRPFPKILALSVRKMRFSPSNTARRKLDVVSSALGPAHGGERKRQRARRTILVGRFRPEDRLPMPFDFGPFFRPHFYVRGRERGPLDVERHGKTGLSSHGNGGLIITWAAGPKKKMIDGYSKTGWTGGREPRVRIY